MHEVDYLLPGWELFFKELDAASIAAADIDERRAEVVARVRRELAVESLAAHPPVAALRKLFKAAGCDPSRYRPSSEALLRRLLKGEALPAIHPLVDANNCLSALLAVPCCVMAEGTFEPPFVFRAGREDESYESLKGPFRLERKPLLVDAIGPVDAPITGSERVKVRPETTRATLVAYLPAGVVTREQAHEELRGVLRRDA